MLLLFQSCIPKLENFRQTKVHFRSPKPYTGTLSEFGTIFTYICLGNIYISDLSKILKETVILLLMEKINIATIVYTVLL